MRVGGVEARVFRHRRKGLSSRQNSATILLGSVLKTVLRGAGREVRAPRHVHEVTTDSKLIITGNRELNSGSGCGSKGNVQGFAEFHAQSIDGRLLRTARISQ